MCTEMACRFERHRAFLSCLWVAMRALEWLLFQMYGQDMFLERRVLAKGLVAGWILGATVLVSTVMSSYMSSKPRTSHETLTTPGAITNIISNSGMSAFNVVVQMRNS